MSALAPLLAKEAREGLWEREVEGIRIWPLVRFTVLDEALRRARGFTAGHAPHPRSGTPWPARLPRQLRTLCRLTAPPACEALFFTPGTVRFRDGVRTRNRLYDDYYRAFAQPLIFETGHPVAEPAQGARHTYLASWLQMVVHLASRLRSPSAQELRVLGDFAQLVAELFGLDRLRDELHAELERHYRWAGCRELLRRLLPARVAGGLAFVHCASYMKWYGLLTTALHDLGLTVVEVQHGYVSREHAAYNYPPECLAEDHPCRRHLPDHLLLFGVAWGEAVRVPSQLHVVGYPHLDRLVRRHRTAEVNPAAILVISQGYVTRRMVALAEALGEAFPARRIIFKLHPGEVPFRHRWAALEARRNMEVVQSGDIHALLARCGVVVGYSSTVLYEALRYPKRRLFILQNDLVPDELGQKFADAEALVAALREPAAGHPATSADRYWHVGWHRSFNNFLEGMA